MPSDFDNFAAEFASPALVEQFGERDEHGEYAKVVVTLPGGEKLELVGVIVSTENVNDVGGYEGTLRPMAQKSLSIPTGSVKGGLRGIPISSTIFLDGNDWDVSKTGHAETRGFIDLQLENPRPRPIDDQNDAGEAVS